MIQKYSRLYENMLVSQQIRYRGCYSIRAQSKREYRIFNATLVEEKSHSSCSPSGFSEKVYKTSSKVIELDKFQKNGVANLNKLLQRISYACLKGKKLGNFGVCASAAVFVGSTTDSRTFNFELSNTAGMTTRLEIVVDFKEYFRSHYGITGYSSEYDLEIFENNILKRSEQDIF